MPPTGSTFTDWQQLEKESRLLMDEDFSWSEPPRRTRQREAEPVRRRRRIIEPEFEPAQRELESLREDWDQPTQPHSHFDEMMAEWNAAYGDAPEQPDYDAYESFDHDDIASYAQAPVHEDRAAAFDLSDPGSVAVAASGRRTVVITGHGDDRYMPAPRRRSPSSELRFHERSTFSPDRAGLWAVLLGIAVLIACVVH